MNDKLIDAVIYQIKKDIENGDITAIELLLQSVPEEYLIEYLPEA